MSHLDFVRPGGQWPGEIVPGAQDYRRTDDAQSRIVNGDGGGNWNPTKPIVVGGAGVILNTTGSLLNGGVSTATGGRVVLLSVAANNTPQLTQPGTDRIILPFMNGYAPTADTSNVSSLPDDFANALTSPGTVGLQSGVQSTSILTEIPGRFLHQGASFTTFVMRFRVLAKPSAVPNPSLTFTPFAWNAGGTSGLITGLAPADPQPWTSGFPVSLGSYILPQLSQTTGFYYKCTTAGGGSTGTSSSAWTTTIGAATAPDSNGVVWTCWGRSGQLPATADAATYYNNGQPQALYYDMDNTVLSANAIDTTGWRYFAGVGNMSDYSSGASASLLNLVVHSFEIDMSNIVDLRFE